LYITYLYSTTGAEITVHAGEDVAPPCKTKTPFRISNW
jgi:hypothetical protein